ERRGAPVAPEWIGIPDLGTTFVVDKVRVDVDGATHAVEYRAWIVERNAEDRAVAGRGIAGAAGPAHLIARRRGFIAHIDGPAGDVRHRRVVEPAGAIDLEVRVEERQRVAVLGPNRVRRFPALVQRVEIGRLARRDENV